MARRWSVALVVLAIAIPIGAPLLLYFSAHGTGTMSWATAAPLVGDVDGDGSDDVIGIGRYVQADEMKLVAVSGKDTIHHRFLREMSEDAFPQRICARLCRVRIF